MQLQRSIRFTPGFDEDGSGRGVDGLWFWMSVTGDKGAVSLSIMTGWMPKKSRREWVKKVEGGETDLQSAAVVKSVFPSSAGIAFHCLEPQSEGDEMKECLILGKCYRGGDMMMAGEALLNRMLEPGNDDETIFQTLEQLYVDRFVTPSSETARTLDAELLRSATDLLP